MAAHSSASKRETPHVDLTATRNRNSGAQTNISDAIKRRAQSLINDRSIDADSRALLRYGLEINDPCLPELVQRVDAGGTLLEGGAILQTSEEKIAALSTLLCRAGDEPETKSAALLVLMATIENGADPKALAKAAKHLAFTRCGELNLNNMVDTQAAALEDELYTAIN